MKRLLLLILICGLLVACEDSANGAEDSSSGNNEVAVNEEPATLAPTIESAVAEADVTEVAAAAPAEDDPVEVAQIEGFETETLILWTASVAQPGLQRADATGDLARLTDPETLRSIVPVPLQANRVELCGQDAISPDGTRAVIFNGLDSNLGGRLSLFESGVEGEPRIVAEGVNFLGCVGGNGTLTFAPDGEQFAYIAYEADARSSEFGDGELRVVNVSDLSVPYTVRNATAFDITAEGVGSVAFFTNNFNEADEAAILWWDGSGEREIATFLAGEDCRFLGSTILVENPERVWTVLVERCPDGTEWQLYRITPDNSLLALTQAPGGAFPAFAEVENLFLSADGRSLWFTLPDGVAANSVSLYGAFVDDLVAAQAVVERYMITPTYSGSPGQALPGVSPDGRWLKFVTSNPAGGDTLTIVDLSDPAAAPIVVEAGSAGDRVIYAEFMPNSESVIFISGGADPGADNALSQLTLPDGDVQRLSRGTFSRWAAMHPSGGSLAVLEWQPLPQGSRSDPFFNLRLVNLENGGSSLAFTGGEVEGVNVINAQFAAPLVWLE